MDRERLMPGSTRAEGRPEAQADATQQRLDCPSTHPNPTAEEPSSEWATLAPGLNRPPVVYFT